MAGIYSQGGSAGHRYAGWLSEVEAKNFQFGGKVFNGSPSSIYVGSNLVWTYWLKHAAMQAIMDAFGVSDGTAVINATNQYLNQLAASDRDKATALAALLNEDPMMVCSLGLSVEGVTMPIRWIKGDGTAYLDFSFLNNKNYSYYKIIAKIDASSSTNNQAIIEGGKYRSFYRSSSSIVCGLTGAASSSISSLKGIFRTYNSGSAGRIDLLNDDYTLKTQGSGVFNAYNQVYSSTKGLKCNTKCEYLKFYNSDMSQEVFEFVPFKSKISGNGMIDLLTGIFYPNANSQGSFTIPDISYTPSTP